MYCHVSLTGCTRVRSFQLPPDLHSTAPNNVCPVCLLSNVWLMTQEELLIVCSRLVCARSAITHVMARLSTVSISWCEQALPLEAMCSRGARCQTTVAGIRTSMQ